MTASPSTKENNSHTHSYSHSNHEKLNRNTLNQRASRARRKDYVSSLELKVREYEAQGVQATEQVQNAARHVAEENRVLKEEMRMLREQVRCLEEVLRRRGVHQSGNGDDGGEGMDVHMEREVELDVAWKRLQQEDRLRRRGQQQPQRRDQHRWQEQKSDETLPIVDDENGRSDAIEGQYPSPPGESEARGPLQRHLHDPLMIRHPVRALEELGFPHARIASFDSSPDADTDEDLQLQEQEQQHTLNGENSSLMYGPVSDIWTQGQGQGHGQTTQLSHPPLQTLSQPSRSSLTTIPSNTTPCEEAALIIASMRGVATSNANYSADILPELGCDAADRSRPCTVDNVRLFGIMDS